MNRALDIAKYIVSKCTEDGKPVSNLQLQKILYFAQKEFLIKLGKPLFDDDVEAWKYGPVVEEVYYYFVCFGALEIIWDFADSKDNITLSGDEKKVLDNVIEQKREKTGWELVAETHVSGGAWEIIYNNGNGNRDVIPRELIQERG